MRLASLVAGHKLFIINSPTWFNTVWSWVKPMLNSAIEEKLKITTNGEKQNAELAKVRSSEERIDELGIRQLRSLICTH